MPKQPQDADRPAESIADGEGAGAHFRDPEELAAHIKTLQTAQEPPRPAGGLQALGLVFSLGTTFAGSLVGGYWLGHLVDERLGTTAGGLIGLLLGLIGGVVGAVQLLKPFMKE